MRQPASFAYIVTENAANVGAELSAILRPEGEEISAAGHRAPPIIQRVAVFLCGETQAAVVAAVAAMRCGTIESAKVKRDFG